MVAAKACVFRTSVQSQLEGFWELEHLGIKAKELEDTDIEDAVRKDITRDQDGHYIVSWPWKPNARKYLPQNKELCEARLGKLLDRQTEEEYSAYNKDIETLEADGHIEKLPEGQEPITYLPHKCVIRETAETTKRRIVKDASAKTKGGMSLNDALDNGPNLLPVLWGIVLRERLDQISLIGDL